jgi:hypothetical protein
VPISESLDFRCMNSSAVSFTKYLQQFLENKKVMELTMPNNRWNTDVKKVLFLYLSKKITAKSKFSIGIIYIFVPDPHFICF